MEAAGEAVSNGESGVSYHIVSYLLLLSKLLIFWMNHALP